MTREEAKELFRNDKDSYGKPKSVMTKIDLIFDSFEKNIPDDYFEITGFKTPSELAAYEKGREHEQKVIMEWIRKWDGSTNSEMGSLLKEKLEPKEPMFCSCKKPWGVSGICIVCNSPIKF